MLSDFIQVYTDNLSTCSPLVFQSGITIGPDIAKIGLFSFFSVLVEEEQHWLLI